MAKSTTFKAASAPATVPTFAADNFDRLELACRPMSDAAALKAKLCADCIVTTPWTVAEAPNHRAVTGEALDLIASSASAACLSHAELQMGSAAPITLDARQLDARRVELRASLDGVPAGPAKIRFYEDDPYGSRALESAATVVIEPQPAHVDGKSAVVSLGDAVIALAGNGFERIRGLLLNGGTYAKDPASTSTSACFSGPPLADAGLTVGQQITAQLLTADGSSGEVFPMTIRAPRPAIGPPVLSPSTSSPYLSTTALAVMLQSAAGALPHQVTVRLRHADGLPQTPCDSLRPDPAAVTLAGNAVHARGAGALALYFRADLLGDRAFGTLQLQVADAATGTGSTWVNLPGTFVRAPRVVQIACPSDPGAACRIYGSELTAIDAVRDASGVFVAPDRDCPPTDKGVACISVQQLAHYTLRLIDEGTIETLHDALIATAKQ